MQLKSISMQGFKSFAKKVNIDLSTPVTGVVGPNGSGKSNVAEAIRFVLGEQSMKGLRSKSGSDLIFKGSSYLSPLSRANVSIHLDNTDKKINEKILSRNSEQNEILLNFINLDEIILTREIYSDGASEYLINGTKVRLKDVQELLAMANISASSHTIVNQGEADRILLSNNTDRREMIEEALGLRIYHMRIKEGEKKLDKVRTHLREIDLLHKENTPHLNFLKKQVKELEKREEEIDSAAKMLKVYFYKEDKEIKAKKEETKHHENIFEKINILEDELLSLSKEKDGFINNQQATESQIDLEKMSEEIRYEEEKLAILNKERDILYKEIVGLDIEIKFLQKKKEEVLNKNPNLNEIKEDIENYLLNKHTFKAYEGNRDRLWHNILSLYEAKKYEELKTDLLLAKEEEKDFFSEIKKEEIQKERDIEKGNTFDEEMDSLRSTEKEKKIKFEELNNSKKEIEIAIHQKLEKKNNLKGEEKEKSYKIDNKILSLKLEIEKLNSIKENIKLKTDNIRNQEFDFENLLKEMSVLIGSLAFQYKSFNEENMADEEKNLFALEQHGLLRKIERSKIRIEESGIINAGEILEEYNNLSERDAFLSNEIADLENSRVNLENLIKDLKETLLVEFNTGLEKINNNFNKYFNEIFSGGKASLIIEKIEKKISEDSLEGDLEEEKEKEPGIEISVNLPEKKVKDLQMLSGGERALASIALIFAMSSINHPPFMVLDETDAALDEANARKYGKMVQRLAERSKLLIITHNRETMNQCDVLYGVTVGAEGCSKLLSIRFDEAIDYAK
ncbi:MAG: chromosome segregation protein [Patescibacteria group bacterium]|nr:chromosome segregation protein [Patescibacteria group bacterium]